MITAQFPMCQLTLRKFLCYLCFVKPFITHICHEDWQKISADGVHPTYDRGAEVIGKIYADYVAELIK